MACRFPRSKSYTRDWWRVLPQSLQGLLNIKVPQLKCLNLDARRRQALDRSQFDGHGATGLDKKSLRLSGLNWR